VEHSSCSALDDSGVAYFCCHSNSRLQHRSKYVAPLGFSLADGVTGAPGTVRIVSAAGRRLWVRGVDQIGKALPEGTSRAERFAFSMLGGLGLFSLALIGQISFTRTTIVTALIVGCLLAIRPLWLAWRNRDSFQPAIRKKNLLPALVVLFVLIITALAGTAEITGDWNQDTVAYHLLGPRVWLRAGVIRPVLDNSPTAFPQIPETLFAVLLAIGGERAPDFSSWFTLGLLLLVSAGLAMRLGLDSMHAWWVAAIVAAMPAAAGPASR
jgi:hypothetical protein